MIALDGKDPYSGQRRAIRLLDRLVADYAEPLRSLRENAPPLTQSRLTKEDPDRTAQDS